MNIKKKTLACSMTATLGSTTIAQAADIQFMTIEDVTGDGAAGAFAFAPPGSTAYTNFFDSTSTITFSPFFASPVVLTPSNAMGITANGVGEDFVTFTAGFILDEQNIPIIPVSFNVTETGGTTTPGGIDGSVNTGDNALSLSQFYWGFSSGTGPIGELYIAASPAGGVFTLNSASQGATQCAVGSTDVCYQLQWEAAFINPQNGFSGDTIWQLEGVAKLDSAVTLSAVPVPAAVWLFGSGLAGLVAVARRRIYKANIATNE